MKIGINVKNINKAVKPKKNDVVIYDGKDWYITTKAELFKEYDERFASVLDKCESKVNELSEFQINIANQLLAMEEIIKKLLQGE